MFLQSLKFRYSFHKSQHSAMPLLRLGAGLLEGKASVQPQASLCGTMVDKVTLGLVFL